MSPGTFGYKTSSQAPVQNIATTAVWVGNGQWKETSNTTFASWPSNWQTVQKATGCGPPIDLYPHPVGV